MQGISIDYVWISPYLPKSTWQDLANSYGTSRISQEIRAPPGFELRKLSNLTNTSECLGSLVGRYMQHTWVVYQDIYIYTNECFLLKTIDYRLPKRYQKAVFWITSESHNAWNVLKIQVSWCMKDLTGYQMGSDPFGRDTAPNQAETGETVPKDGHASGSLMKLCIYIYICVDSVVWCFGWPQNLIPHRGLVRHPPNPAKICQNHPIWHHFSFVIIYLSVNIQNLHSGACFRFSVLQGNRVSELSWIRKLFEDPNPTLMKSSAKQRTESEAISSKTTCFSPSWTQLGSTRATLKGSSHPSPSMGPQAASICRPKELSGFQAWKGICSHRVVGEVPKKFQFWDDCVQSFFSIWNWNFKACIYKLQFFLIPTPMLHILHEVAWHLSSLARRFAWHLQLQHRCRGGDLRSHRHSVGLRSAEG